MARYIDADKLVDWCKKTFQVQSTVAGKAYVDAFLTAVLSCPASDVAPRAEVAREIFEEIMRAMERGVAEADKAVINNTSILDFRESLCRAGEMYAGYIGVAICKVFQKYTEGEK